MVALGIVLFMSLVAISFILWANESEDKTQDKIDRWLF